MTLTKLSAFYWTLTAACCVSIPTARAALRWANPELAVAAPVMGGPSHIQRDPWGSSWVTLGADEGYAFYSVGPNRVDDGGAGDDVDMVKALAALGNPHLVGGERPIWLSFVIWPERWLGGLTLLLVFMGAVPGRNPPRKHVGLEFLHSLALAVLPALLLSAGAYHLLDFNRGLVSQGLAQAAPPVVPLELAVISTVGLLCFAVAFAWRMSRREPVDDAHDPRFLNDSAEG